VPFWKGVRHIGRAIDFPHRDNRELRFILEHPMAETPSHKDALRQAREERLAAQLRENLKKRKTQARTRRDSATKSGPADDQA
jgi:hypothetical protein